MNAGGSRWIRRFNQSPSARTRLICFPHAGGSANFYLPFSRALSGDVDVVAVQYPGRQDRLTEPGAASIAELVGQIFEALRQHVDHPVALFGHSMGAIVAFEVARRLEAELGVVPVRLFASGRRAPSRYREENIHRLDDKDLLVELRSLSGTGGRVLDNEEIMGMALPAIRADYRLIETYRFQRGVQLSCPVSVLLGDADPLVTLSEANAWRSHTTGKFESHVFPGGHFYLDGQRDQVLAVIRAAMSAPR
jgi:surfactin synthase thioesterase subunit